MGRALPLVDGEDGAVTVHLEAVDAATPLDLFGGGALRAADPALDAAGRGDEAEPQQVASGDGRQHHLAGVLASLGVVGGHGDRHLEAGPVVGDAAQQDLVEGPVKVAGATDPQPQPGPQALFVEGCQFVRVADGDSYKAVANAFSYKSGKKKLTAVAVETAPSGAAADWASEFTSLNADQWRNRTEIGYQAKGRHCSAPVAGNTVVSGGVATLKMVEVTNAASKAEVVALAKQEQAKEAGATYTKAAAKVTSAQAGVDKANALSSATTAQKKKRDAEIKKAKKALTSAQAAVAALTPGCPSGVFTNAMITTSGKDVTDPFTIKQGTVVARVKFTPGQGAHAGIWLQDSATRQEIDIIEAYGYGRGITNIVHRLKGTALVQDPASATSGYVAVKTVASKAWWSKWHTVAVTFDSGSVTFYLDGVKTKSLSGMTGDYTLMASMLSSDWETPRVKKPVLRPGSKVKKSSLKKTSLPTMQIDWIRAWGEIS